MLAVEALEREVNSGGYLQFFEGESRRHAPIVVEALRRIGCGAAAELTREAIDAAGTAESLSDDVEDALERCDERYYEEVGDLAGPLLAFVREHRDQITVP